MNVELPDGTVVEDIPEGISKLDLAKKLKANGMKVPDEWLAGQEVGLGEAARRGAVRGAGHLVRGLGVLGAGPIAKVAEMFGNTEVGDKLFAAADDFAKWGEESTKPAEGEVMSEAAKGVQAVAGAVPTLAGMAAMGPVAGAVLGGGGSGADTYATNLEQGVDNATALKQAGLAAGMNAAGMVIPAAIPGRLALRLISGGAVNAATGHAQREASNAVYGDKYPQMHQDFSPGEFAADFVVGAGIGGAAGKAKGKAKTEAPPTFPADKMQDLGDGNYRAPNGAPITKEMWEGSTQRSRDGWMKEAPPEEAIPVGEAKEISADEAVAQAARPDTSAIDKALEQHPTGPIAEAAKAAKAKKIKAAEAAAKKVQDAAHAAEMRRTAATVEDADFKAELLARAEKLDPPGKIPVGEVKEGQPDIPVSNEKIPVGEVTAEYPAGHTPVLKEEAPKAADTVPAGEARELYVDPNREEGATPPKGSVNKEGQIDTPVPDEKIPVGEATELKTAPEIKTPVDDIKNHRPLGMDGDPLYVPPKEKASVPGKVPKQEGVRQERGQGNEVRSPDEAGAGRGVQRAAQGERKGTSEETLDLGLPQIDEAFMREQERVAPRGADARAAAAPDERGRRHVHAEMERAVAEGRLDKDVAATAAWALEKNPNLAAGMKLRAGGEAPRKGARGAYDDAHRVVEVFKGTKDPKTLVHELLHHSERMMPQKVQDAIRREWRRRIDAEAAKTKDPARKALLADIPKAVKGDAEARERLRDAVVAGKLDYHLVDPSEFWAVNAAKIFNERHGSRNAWHTQARQWVRELVEHLKSTVGMRSDAPILKALDEVLNPKRTTGVDRSPALIKKAAGEGDSPTLALGPEGKLPEETKAERSVREVFDSFKRVQTAQEVAGITHEDADMRLAIRLNLGNIQGRMEKFEKEHTKPLAKALEDAKKAGVTVRDADDYVTALHAPERNAVILQRDPKNKAGSGYTDQQAKDVIASFTPEQIKHLDKIAGLVRKINHEKLEAMVSDGLITPETRDALNKQFKNYVPLKNLDDEAKFTGAGRGYQTWANDIAAATGRTTRAGSPIAATMMDATHAIARGERAKVNKVIWKFANHADSGDIIRAYDPENPPPSVMKAELDKDGKKHMVVDRGELDAQTLSIVVDGHPKKVFISDPALKEALATAGTPQQIGKIVRAISKGTRAFSRTLTEWNVAFAPVNQVKDLGTALIRAKRLGIDATAFNPVAVAKAWKAVFDHTVRGKRTGDAAVYDEMINAGGKTGGYGLTNLADTMASLEKMGADLGYEDHKGGVGRKLAKVAEAVGDGLSHYNEVFEYSTRLVAYKAARAKGMTPKRAAEVARKITVDFNVNGELGRRLGHVYAFANAALQGLHGDALDLKSPKTRYRMLSMVALGAAVQVYNETFGGVNEETGDLNVDSQPDYSLDSSVTVLGKDSRSGVKIPLPPGIATGLYTLGRRLARLSQASGAEEKVGKPRDMERESTGILSAAVQSLLPVRFADGANQITNVAQGLTPALARPVADISVNSSQFGSPIVPTSKDTKSPPPAYMLSRHNTSQIAKEMSKFANDVTGGDEVKPGASQKYLGNFVAPEAIEYLAGYYTGGAGQLALQSKNIVKNAAEGKPQEINKIPVARRFAFTEPESYTSRRFHELQTEYEYAKDYERAGQSAKIAPRIQASLEQYQVADKELTALFKQLRETKEDKDREPIQQQIKAVQSRVIKAYNQTGQ